MSSDLISCLLQEEQSIRNEISTIQQSQRRMVFTVIGTSGSVVPFLTIFLTLYGGGPSENLILMGYIFMALSVVTMLMLGIYGGLSFGILRLTNYLNINLYPRIQEVLGSSSSPFQWEMWVRKKHRQDLFSWISMGFYIISEFLGIFAIFMIFTSLWIWIFVSKGGWGDLQSLLLAIEIVYGLTMIGVAGVASKKASNTLG